MRVLGAWAGIIGPVLLAAYFGIPALVHWPSASASSGTLIAFANAHRTLFYLGGWLQVTGALLSILFFLLLLQLSGARRTLAGSATIVGCAVLVSVVAIEAVLLEEVPLAAANVPAAGSRDTGGHLGLGATRTPSPTTSRPRRG